MLDIKITQLDCDTTSEEYPMCVTQIHYYITKSQGDHAVSTYGAVGVSRDEEADYTAFEDLTEDQVKGWLGLDLEAIEAQLDAELAEKVAPKTVSVSPPFAVEEVVEE